MNTVITIVAHELRTMYRRRVFQVLTVGLPVLAAVGLTIVWFVQNVVDADEGKEETKKVAYVDGTALFTAHLMQESLEFVEYPSRDLGMEALLAEDVKRLYVIPANYLKTGRVERFEVGLGLNLGGGDNGLRSFLLDNLSESAPQSEVIDRIRDPLLLSRVAVDATGVEQDLDEARVFFFLGLAFLLMFSLGMTGDLLIEGLGEEKESRTIEVLLSSVTPGQLLAGKVLGLSAAGLSQILVWVVSGRIILELLPSVFTALEFSLPGLGITLLAMVVFALGYLLYATVYAGVGAISPTIRESQQLSLVLAVPMLAPALRWVYFVENPTAMITRALTFFPFTGPLIVLQRLGANAIEWWDVAISLGILSVAIAGAMFVVARVFRAFLLSYGNRPSLRLVWRTLVRR